MNGQPPLGDDPRVTHRRRAVDLRINEQSHRLECDVRATLLDVLREDLDLTGTKKGCDRGQCGACTVLVDGRRTLACLTLAVAAQDRDVITIEGIAALETGVALQESFVAQDGFQCGFCTPGQICSAVGMIDEAKLGWPSAVTEDADGGDSVVLEDDEIRERLSGNICRCGAYVNILAAVRDVATDQVRSGS